MSIGHDNVAGVTFPALPDLVEARVLRLHDIDHFASLQIKVSGVYEQTNSSRRVVAGDCRSARAPPHICQRRGRRAADTHVTATHEPRAAAGTPRRYLSYPVISEALVCVNYVYSLCARRKTKS